MLKKDPNFFLQLAKEMLEAGNNFRFKATGKSMHPFIEDGDILTIAPLSKPVKVGHVAFYTDKADHLMAHRVHKIIKTHNVTQYIIKGDAKFHYPEYIDQTKIIGIAVSLNRNDTKENLDSFFNRYYPIFMIYYQQYKNKIKVKIKQIFNKILIKLK